MARSTAGPFLRKIHSMVSQANSFGYTRRTKARVDLLPPADSRAEVWRIGLMAGMSEFFM